MTLSLLFSLAASAYSPSDIPVTIDLDPIPVDPAEYQSRIAPGPLVARTLRADWPTGRRAVSRGRVAILVEADLASALSSELDRWSDDLLLDGYSVVLEELSGGSGADLKAHLQELYADGLDGAVLVGDLPVLYYHSNNDYPGYYLGHDNDYGDGVGYGYGPTTFACDLALADLDGTWTDRNGDGMLDGHDGSAPEIWIGRMVVTPTMGDAADVLSAYLDRNHAYRRGELESEGSSLVYVDNDWSWWTSSYESEISLGFPDTTAVGDDPTTTKSDYIPRLTQGYDNVAVFVHSSPDAHYFYGASSTDTMYWTDVPAASDALFYDLFACSNSDFTAYVYMGGVYALQTERGLLSLGSTKTGSMLERTSYYRRLGQYQSFGDALQGWWGDVQPYDVDDRLSWYYGLIHTGDPTLRVGWPEAETSIEVIDEITDPGLPVQVRFDLSNVGVDTMPWSMEPTEEWITAQPSSGSLGEGESQEISVVLDPDLLTTAAADTELEIFVQGATNNPVRLPVSLQAWEPAEICVEPASLQATVDEGSTGLVELTVSNCASGPLSFSLATSDSWIGLPTPAGGAVGDGDSLTLSIELDSVQGPASGTLLVSSPDAANSPVEVTVDLDVLEAPKGGCSSTGLPAAWLLGLVGLLGLRLRR